MSEGVSRLMRHDLRSAEYRCHALTPEIAGFRLHQWPADRSIARGDELLITTPVVGPLARFGQPELVGTVQGVLSGWVITLFPAGTQDSEHGPMLERFRGWLGGHIWAEDDMGGFLQCGTALSWQEEQAQMMANVAQLFDLLDPDWRSHTGRARRDG